MSKNDVWREGDSLVTEGRWRGLRWPSDFDLDPDGFTVPNAAGQRRLKEMETTNTITVPRELLKELRDYIVDHPECGGPTEQSPSHVELLQHLDALIAADIREGRRP